MRWFRTWFRRNTIDRDLERELSAHLDLHVHDLIRRGLPADTARRRARIDLGGVDQITARVRDARAGAWLEPLLHDGRDAFRGLKRTPGVTVTAMALIALVIGGNTSIYSMVHAVLTKPAPGVRGDRLVTLQQRVDGRPAGPEHSYPDYLEYAAQNTTLVPLMASEFQRFAATIDEETYALVGGLVTSNYFDTLGLRLARGRAFTEAESRLDASGLVAVVSERVWQTQFRGAEDVIGRSILLNGQAATVVGVAPPQFRGAWVGETGDIWVPLLAYHRMHGRVKALADRSDARMQVIGRLAPGASLAHARAEFATLSARLQAAFPDTSRHRSIGLVPYSMTAGGDNLIATQAPRFLAIFSIVTALTLVIVCANVANLMLGRAVVRQRELALRQTLGASRARILRLLLAEGAIISTAAWAVACVFALAVSKGVPHFFQPSAQGATLLLDLTPDWQVIAYAFALALLGTMAFTIAPAVRSWKQELLPSLRSGELGVVAGRSKLSGVLVIVQLAFAVLLLTSAGLAYRSLSLLELMDVGFKQDHLVLANVVTAESAATKEANLALLSRLRERLQVVRGIESVSYIRSFVGREPVWIEGSQQPLAATTVSIGPDYFRVLGLAPLAGRVFAESEASRPANAVLLTHDLAESLWPGQSPLGRTLQVGRRRQPFEVVGVTPDGVFSRFRRESNAFYVFKSLAQEPLLQETFTFYLRYSGDLATIAPTISRAFLEVDNRVPVAYLRTMETEMDDFPSAVRIVAIWLTLFAVGSLVIAAIGQYAVVAFDMRRRTRDFGVRVALGASSQQILGSVLGEGLRSTGAGLVIGFALSFAAGLAFRSLLVGVTPTDARTYLGVFTLLTFASLLACYLPARRAARIDPIQTLRQE